MSATGEISGTPVVQRKAGRPKGTPNKANRGLRAAAREFSLEALETLVDIMRYGESEDARIRAANAVLDRAHGRPAQAVKIMADEGENENPFSDVLEVKFRKPSGEVIDVTPTEVLSSPDAD